VVLGNGREKEAAVGLLVWPSSIKMDSAHSALPFELAYLPGRLRLD